VVNGRNFLSRGNPSWNGRRVCPRKQARQTKRSDLHFADWRLCQKLRCGCGQARRDDSESHGGQRHGDNPTFTLTLPSFRTVHIVTTRPRPYVLKPSCVTWNTMHCWMHASFLTETSSKWNLRLRSHAKVWMRCGHLTILHQTTLRTVLFWVWLLKTKSPGTGNFNDVSTSTTSNESATSTRSYKEALLGWDTTLTVWSLLASCYTDSLV
jgi:hypothetical protein